MIDKYEEFLSLKSRCFIGIAPLWQAYWLGVALILGSSFLGYLVSLVDIKWINVILLGVWLGVLFNIHTWYIKSVFACRKNADIPILPYLAIIHTLLASVSIVIALWSLPWYFLLAIAIGSFFAFRSYQIRAATTYPLQFFLHDYLKVNENALRDCFSRSLGKDLCTDFDSDVLELLKKELLEVSQNESEKPSNYSELNEVELTIISKMGSDILGFLLPTLNIQPTGVVSRFIYEVWMDYDIRNETGANDQARRVMAITKNSRRTDGPLSKAKHLAAFAFSYNSIGEEENKHNILDHRTVLLAEYLHDDESIISVESDDLDDDFSAANFKFLLGAYKEYQRASLVQVG